MTRGGNDMATDTAVRSAPRAGTGTKTRDPRDPRNPRDPRDRRQVTAPRHTRPVTGLAPRPVTRPVTSPAAKSRRRSPRAPFILLLVGLLGGALVSLLVISTTLAQGAFQITNLQQQNASLARQEQSLSNAVAQAAAPAVIGNEAHNLGMRSNPNLHFLNLKNGKIVTGKVSKSDAEINVPGYNP
jgi:hypothetical protein